MTMSRNATCKMRSIKRLWIVNKRLDLILLPTFLVVRGKNTDYNFKQLFIFQQYMDEIFQIYAAYTFPLHNLLQHIWQVQKHNSLPASLGVNTDTLALFLTDKVECLQFLLPPHVRAQSGVVTYILRYEKTHMYSWFSCVILSPAKLLCGFHCCITERLHYSTTWYV